MRTGFGFAFLDVFVVVVIILTCCGSSVTLVP